MFHIYILFPPISLQVRFRPQPSAPPYPQWIAKAAAPHPAPHAPQEKLSATSTIVDDTTCVWMLTTMMTLDTGGWTAAGVTRGSM